MDLLKAFLDFIQDHQLFDKSERLLVAVSGGVDSMVLVNLLHSAEFSFDIAHVNYGLRGAESFTDEGFVQNWGDAHQIPVYIHRPRYDGHSNVQVWARDVRYAYFDALMKSGGYHSLLTAHHFDDQIETFILNFTRGSGHEGLGGIRVRRGYIKRPLLFARKSDIQRFAVQHQLMWREDRTNATDNYLRNMVRHRIVPVLDELRGHDEGMRATLAQMAQLNQWMHDQMSAKLNAAYDEKGEWTIPWSTSSESGVLFDRYEMLHRFGFHFDQIQQMSQHTTTGNQFYTDTHIALLDRGMLRIRVRHQYSPDELLPIDRYQQNDMIEFGAIELHVSNSIDPSAELNNHHIVLDADAVKWPLYLRRWREGDRFQPYGMFGKTKKVSDLLINLKLSIFDKQDTIILHDDSGTILWILGWRRSIHGCLSERSTDIRSLKIMS